LNYKIFHILDLNSGNEKKLSDCFNALLFIALILIISSCKEKPGQPVLTTAEVAGITQTSAVAGGNVVDDGGSPVEERGVCWNISGNPTVGDNRTYAAGETGSFTCDLSELMPDTQYYVRAYATNENGTGYGNEVTFTTLLVLPVSITTMEITSITATGAVSGGNISDAGGGTITAKGVCWAETENPTTDDFRTEDGSVIGLYNSYLTGLESVTTYYVRAYATNNSGTAYGNQLTFTTDVSQSNPVVYNSDLTYGSVSDIEGNSYQTIQIGDQIWMAGNLRTTKYNDASVISNITTDELWNSFASGAYCWYNNDISNKDIYGALYNWYAVSTGKLCPTGWHIPSPTEWITMIDHIGGASVAGGLMKEVGTTHWLSPNTGATNEMGFTALPAGIRTSSGYFQGMGSTVRWWKSTEGYVVEVTNESAEVIVDACCVYRRGLSVRCLKE
jgi:uncharacterized protein (TIGR02145 family)